MIKQKKFLQVIALTLVALAAILFTSCGESSSTQETPSGHKLTAEEREKIIADTVDDLSLIAGIQTDTSLLGTAMTGKALDEMKQTVEKDLAEGKVKKREYRNVTAEFEEINFPYAEVLAEFDDFSYFTDAKTGATLSQPTGTHMRFAMALIEEDGNWKIQGIFAPSTPETPRQLPQTSGATGTSP